MERSARSKCGNGGVALLTALGLLFIFSAFGMAFVTYMTTTLERSQFETRSVRARHIAAGGIQVAIGRLQSALASGKIADALSAPGECEFPLYQYDAAALEKISPMTDRRWAVGLTITDESGKVNLNYAPTRVLQAILGVDGDTARKIRSALPPTDPAGAPASAANQRWLTSLDDLVTRGLISPAAFDAIPKRLATVHSVADPARPVRFLNVNAAPPAVLAAVLDLPLDAAKQVAQKRPFASFADLSAAAGKDPSAFIMKPAPDPGGTLPGELSLQSRCFRIESIAELMARKADGSEYRITRSRAEAVVVFDDGGAPQITFWSEALERAEAGKAQAVSTAAKSGDRPVLLEKP